MYIKQLIKIYVVVVKIYFDSKKINKQHMYIKLTTLYFQLQISSFCIHHSEMIGPEITPRVTILSLICLSRIIDSSKSNKNKFS